MRIAVPAAAAVLALSTLTVAGDAAVTTSASMPCGGQVPRAVAGWSFSCTYSDDFSGTSIDRNRWMVQATSYSGVTDAHRDCYLDSPDVLSESGGMVHLTARRYDKGFGCKSPYGLWGTRYAVSTIATRTHFSQAFGRFEFRARMPRAAGPGLHAALWLYPAANTYGRWPGSGEIDVAEWFSNRPTIALNALHYWGNFQNAGISCTTTTPQDFHNYAVEWGYGVMTFYLDGKACWQHAWVKPSILPGLAPFDKPFYFVLSMGFGNASNAPTTTTPAVNTMDVDWVRAWSLGRS